MQYLNCGFRAQFPPIMLSKTFYARRALTFRRNAGTATAISRDIPSSLGIDNGAER